MIYDLIIVGSGIAGVTAAIYAKRSGKNVLVIEKGMLGGTIGTTEIVENYPGIPNISGADLAFKFFDHLNTLEIPHILKEVTTIVVNKDGSKVVKTKSEDYICKKVIVAVGRKPKLLDMSNKDLLGRGLSTCALCDANFYKGKDVAVVGGGNSAVGEAIYLSKIVNKVYLIHRKNEFSADRAAVDKLKDINNIEIIYDSNVTKIETADEKISGIILNKEREIPVSGVFMYIGYTPSTEFLEDLNILDEKGYITVDESFETKIPGIYACGDTVKKSCYQLVVAASEGAQAAINACQ